jgi:hypothetical protein
MSFILVSLSGLFSVRSGDTDHHATEETRLLPGHSDSLRNCAPPSLLRTFFDVASTAGFDG